MNGEYRVTEITNQLIKGEYRAMKGPFRIIISYLRVIKGEYLVRKESRNF